MDQTPKVSSKQFSLNWQDALRGLLMAVGRAVFAVIQTSLEAGQLNFNWKQIGIVAGGLSSGLSYKEFFSNPLLFKHQLLLNRLRVLH